MFFSKVVDMQTMIGHLFDGFVDGLLRNNPSGVGLEHSMSIEYNDVEYSVYNRNLFGS